MRAIGIALLAGISLAIVYAVFDLRRDHNQTNRIREECQRTNSEAGKVKECITDLALRHASIRSCRKPEPVHADGGGAPLCGLAKGEPLHGRNRRAATSLATSALQEKKPGQLRANRAAHFRKLRNWR